MIALLVTCLESLCVYLDWLSFPLIIITIWCIKKHFYTKTAIAFLILSILFIWAHYIEPQIIRVKQTTIYQQHIRADIILISDLHLGFYKDERFLQRVVDKINALKADYVVIAGDFSYKANPDEYSKLYAPLAKINKPVYAVRGNHDYLYRRRFMPAILARFNVQMIEGKMVDLGSYQLAGLADRLAAKDDASFLRKADKSKPILVIAHNPDSSDRLASYNVPLLLAGHTHCGQVYLPFVDRLVIRSQYNYTCGYSTNMQVPVFITPGIGEDNLPLRLFNPPTISLLHLRP